MMLFCVYLILFKQTNRKKRVVLGNEIFISRHLPEIKNKKLGLIVNHTSRLPNGMTLVDALLEKGAAVKALFSLEHGFLGDQEAGQIIEHSQYKGIPIYSLHGNNKRPTPRQVRDIDAFVYDIQDVGARFYTYITTMKYILESAAYENIPVYILDRPNPTGGEIIEGPILDMKLESFTAPCPIPIRYGMTCGELALMMKGENWIPNHTEIQVIQMKGWDRKFSWEDTGLPWIPASPNIPQSDTALAYPGTSLLGGIGLNHGIGTLNPFLQFGAPWLDPEIIVQDMDKKYVQGVKLTPHLYIPRSLPGKTSHPPYKDRHCHGILISILQKKGFRSFEFTLDLIRTLKTHYPNQIKVITDKLDSLFGNEWLRLYIEEKLSYEKLKELIEKDEETFRQQRKPYLLY
ncbi:MAG: exo-beta-N-acetylmuramidase NamZ domain-containing protein [Acidobacteriota bacterium]